MSEELFAQPESLSPRAVWIRENGVTENTIMVGGTANYVAGWGIHAESASSRDDALHRLAMRMQRENSIKHWGVK